MRAEKTHVYSNKNWVKQMSEAITLRKTLIAAALTAAAGGALAAELGSLMVYSAAGEPLDAELTIRDVDPKAEQLMVRLAPASTYRRVGKEVVLDLNDISLTLLRKNPYTVKIKGKDAVNAQKFPLIVELSEAGKLSAKLYEVKLQDRPEAPMVKEGVVDGSKTAAPIVDASTGDRTQVPSAAKQPVRSAAAPKVESAASTKPAVKSAVPSAAPTAKETSKPAAEPVYAARARAREDGSDNGAKARAAGCTDRRKTRSQGGREASSQSCRLRFGSAVPCAGRHDDVVDCHALSSALPAGLHGPDSGCLCARQSRSL